MVLHSPEVTMTRALLPLLALSIACSCPTQEPGAPVEAPAVVSPPPPPERAPITRLRGLLSRGEHGLLFRACDAEEELRVVGSASEEALQVHTELSGDSGQERIYVEVVGAMRSKGTGGGMVAVESLQVALPEAGSSFCEYDASYHYKAHGNEPFWNVTVVGGELRFEAMDADEPFVQPAIEARVPGHSGPAWRAEADGRMLELLLVVERCWDGMSGAAYPYSAKVNLDGQSFTGCAHQGWPPAD